MINDKSKYHDFILYEIIDMSNWCKKGPILKLLEQSGNRMNERVFRGLVAYNNILFAEGQRELYIAHSENGYIATLDEHIIRASTADLRARAYDMLSKANQTEKQLSKRGYNPLLWKKNYILHY